MAYNAPAVQATGTLITAGIWNIIVNDILLTAPAIMTATGDTLYASAANTPARLAIGGGGALYRTNDAGTAPGWSLSWKETSTSGHLVPQTDAAKDIGTLTGPLRIRNIHGSGKLGMGSTAAGVTSRAISLASGAVAQLMDLASAYARVDLCETSIFGQVASFFCRGSNNAVNELNDPGGVYSPTAGTTNLINVYYSTGNARYEVQNATTSSATIQVGIYRLTGD